MNKVLLTLIMLINVGSIRGMELETQPSMTLAQLYYYFAYDVLLPEIAQQIFSLHCGNSNLTELGRNCKDPNKFEIYIKTLITSYGYPLASELYECFFVREKISVCDIKNVHKQTSLHLTINRKVVQILLRVAGDNAFKLLTIQDDNGWTALHMAAYFNRIKIAKLFLNAASKKAPDLIKLKTGNGQTALDLACDNPEVKEVIQSYVTNKK